MGMREAVSNSVSILKLALEVNHPNSATADSILEAVGELESALSHIGDGSKAEPVGEVTSWVNFHPVDQVYYQSLTCLSASAIPAGTKLYTHPAPAPDKPQWISCAERLPTVAESWRWLVWAVRKGCTRAEIVGYEEVGPEEFICWATPKPQAPEFNGLQRPSAPEEGES